MEDEIQFEKMSFRYIDQLEPGENFYFCLRGPREYLWRDEEGYAKLVRVTKTRFYFKFYSHSPKTKKHIIDNIDETKTYFRTKQRIKKICTFRIK